MEGGGGGAPGWLVSFAFLVPSTVAKHLFGNKKLSCPNPKEFWTFLDCDRLCWGRLVLGSPNPNSKNTENKISISARNFFFSFLPMLAIWITCAKFSIQNLPCIFGLM